MSPPSDEPPGGPTYEADDPRFQQEKRRFVSAPKKRLGEVLIDAGALTQDDLARALRDQRAPREKLGETVIRLGLSTELGIAQALADQLGLPLIDLSCAAIEQEAIQLVPERTARKHLLVPLALYARDLHVAIADPLKLEALEDVAFASGCVVRPYIATPSEITRAIDKHYHLGVSLSTLVKDIEGERQVEVLKDRPDSEAKDTEDLRKRSEAAPIVRMVNLIIAQAVDQGASDIHIEPGKTQVAIRTRVDGILRQSLEAPKWVQGPVISRIKIMARMDIAEKRLPQDGRIAVRVSDKSLDLRVSTVPSAHGEKVVIRVLDSANSRTPLAQVGLGARELSVVESLLRRPQGLILVTGPTGSGKTSTLYAMLNHVRSVERSITTIEDPVEYELEGINQTAVQEKIGLTFASMLRATLRQDPDVIMVGEMRDVDTAGIAMQASVTGHLVLSTMHTNNAVATITRLRNVGIQPYVIASAVTGILAQRLVRRICPSCCVETTLSKEERDRMGLRLQKQKLRCYTGKGCASCNGNGYRGRVGIFEALPIDGALREVIAANGTEADLRRVAVANGMETLFTAGLKQVRAGVTTLSELFRVIDIDEESSIECPGCGELLDAEYVACPSCAHRFAATCQSCQRRVSATWKICGYCGGSVGMETPPSLAIAARGQKRSR